jgi:predicted MFS family arabinose efflux permease
MQRARISGPRSTRGAPVPLQWLMAGSAGLIMANLYYAQPLSAAICASLQLPIDHAGLLTTVPLGAYGFGLLMIVPLADRIDNRPLVLALTACVGACALLLSFAQSTSAYLFAAALLGASAAAVQVLVPYSTYLVPPEQSAQAVGRVVSGVMIGIMSARPAASLIASQSDWRVVFRCSAVLLAVDLIVLGAALPARRPSSMSAAQSYRALLMSLGRIAVREPVLRLRALCHSCLFGAFATFWTAVPLWLAGPPFRLVQNQIGWVCLAGVAGAFGPPLAARLAVRGLAQRAAPAAMLVASAAFLLSVPVTRATGIAPVAGAGWIAALAVLLDLAVASHLVFCQRAIYALAPGERSRVNALFMASFLAGGAVCSALSGWLFARFGWHAVAALGTVLPMLAWATLMRRPAG